MLKPKLTVIYSLMTSLLCIRIGKSRAAAAHSSYIHSANSADSFVDVQGGRLFRPSDLEWYGANVVFFFGVRLGELTDMARSLLARMASAVALVSTSVMLSGCWTIAGRPILCDFIYGAKDARCAKVTKAKAPRRDRQGAGHSREY